MSVVDRRQPLTRYVESTGELLPLAVSGHHPRAGAVSGDAAWNGAGVSGWSRAPYWARFDRLYPLTSTAAIFTAPQRTSRQRRERHRPWVRHDEAACGWLRRRQAQWCCSAPRYLPPTSATAVLPARP